MGRYPAGVAALTCMCMHVIMLSMRTTIEIPDEQRARLLRLAAERGQKGFSGIVQDALERYLDEQERRSQKVEAAIDVLGTLSEDGAERLHASVRSIRERWR